MRPRGMAAEVRVARRPRVTAAVFILVDSVCVSRFVLYDVSCSA